MQDQKGAIKNKPFHFIPREHHEILFFISVSLCREDQQHAVLLVKEFQLLG